jgi:hypothetical protein
VNVENNEGLWQFGYDIIGKQMKQNIPSPTSLPDPAARSISSRSELSSTGYGSGCTTQALRFKSPRMRIWVLIIYLKKLAVGVSPTAFLSKKDRFLPG